MQVSRIPLGQTGCELSHSTRNCHSASGYGRVSVLSGPAYDTAVPPAVRHHKRTNSIEFVVCRPSTTRRSPQGELPTGPAPPVTPQLGGQCQGHDCVRQGHRSGRCWKETV
ncbi:hypothetical protein SGPA1_12166 [Streptomyces misionensis JCM 4497]